MKKIIFVLILFLPSFGRCQTFKHGGLCVSWMIGKFEERVNPQLGLRYIPEFSLKNSFSGDYVLDAEFSLNGYGVVQFDSADEVETDGEIKPYRLWLRFSSSQFEARLGLQKINFGSAMLLRSLMWFDRIDPRDPLQLTDGVYGLLIRYYFLNNSNIWLWGLYGNDEPKGFEAIPNAEDTIELGGRFQVPVGNGELAFTYHHRQVDLSKGPFPISSPSASPVPENRYALDGKWDIGIGIWFEGALIHQHSDELLHPWRRALTLGMDYTFNWGNGLNFLVEYFVFETSKDLWGSGEDVQFAGVMLHYPLGLLDAINFISFYDFDNKDLYSFVRWERTYDRWSFHVMGFWNPDRFQVYPTRPESSQFAGKGIQIMAVYYY